MTRTLVDLRLGIELKDLDRPVLCPAGDRIDTIAAGPGCHCKITESVITAAGDPSTLAAFCMNESVDGLEPDVGYVNCPVWRDAREREWRGQKPLLEEPEGNDLKTQTIAARNERAFGQLIEREFFADGK